MRNKKPEVFDKLLKEQLMKTPLDNLAQCPDENVVAAYLEQQLPAALRVQFEAHAAQCARCRKELALLLKTSAETVPLAALKETPQPLLSSLRKSLFWLQTISMKPAFALLIVGVLCGVIGLRVFRNGGEREPYQPQVAKVQMPPQELASETSPPGEPVQKISPQKSEDTLAQRASRQSVPSAVPASPNQQASAGAIVSQPEESLESFRKEMSTKDKRSEAMSMAENRPADAEMIAQVNNDESKQAPQQLPFNGRNKVELKAAAPPPPAPAKGDLSQSSGAYARASTERSLGADYAVAPEILESERKLAIKPQAEQEKSPSHVVAGKKFFLKQGTWVDDSISSEEALSPLVLYRKSPADQKILQQLKAFSEMLALPEDVMLKKNGKVYLIKTSP